MAIRIRVFTTGYASQFYQITFSIFRQRKSKHPGSTWNVERKKRFNADNLSVITTKKTFDSVKPRQ